MAGFRWPTQGKPPASMKLRSSAGLIVTTCSFACFTDIFLYAVIVPVMPFSLHSRVGIDADRVQYWISISLAVYGASLLAFSPIWGYIADRYQNRKMPMLTGLVSLLAATVVLCVSRSLAMFMLGRALQGISAALTWTVGLALVIDTVDEKDVGMACGWVGMGASLGILSAPLLGGVVYARGGYYSVFAMCFGLLAVDIMLRLAIVEVKEARKWLGEEETAPPTLDVEGKAAPQPQPVMPQSVIVDGDSRPDTAESSKGETPGFLATVVSLLRKPRFLAALWGTLAHAAILTSFDSTLPLLTSDLFGWNSIGSGLIFLPAVLPSFASPVIGAVCDRYGPKWPATVGFFLATPFLICTRFVTEDTLAHKVMLCGLLFGVGLAITCVFSPLMAEINWAVQSGAEESGVVPVAQAYGLYNMAYSGGTMLGPIMGGLIRDEAGWKTVGWSLGILTFVSAIPQLIWTGGDLGIKFKRGAGS